MKSGRYTAALFSFFFFSWSCVIADSNGIWPAGLLPDGYEAGELGGSFSSPRYLT